MKELNLDTILKSYLTVEAMQANKPDYTYNMVIAAMKHACCEVLDLAAKNATGDVYNIPGPGDLKRVSINKGSILQIKDWIK